MGIQVVHTWLGCVVAATIIALTLMYRNARAAFEQIDENVIYAARKMCIRDSFNVILFTEPDIPITDPTSSVSSMSTESMTLKCIAGIETPDSGFISLNGRVPVSYTHLDVYKRQRLGF